uniref:Solute carrier family 24 member 3 n=1 Tax=Cyprinus carpio TaxID=7962 RepID=A0A8C1G501_CYPCA
MFNYMMYNEWEESLRNVCAALCYKWTIHVAKCVSVYVFCAGIHEFPDDIFTNQERMEGAVALHVLCAMYMFYALALVCDDYFVPSLEKICERLHLSEDVAGATFMAAGSSAPELFTSVIGVFITKGDVGVGTIVGSAVFNILCIIGVCGIFTAQVLIKLHMNTYPKAVLVSHFVLYSVIYATFSLLRWESLTLTLLYIVYIILMKFNSRPSVMMVDELLSAYPHQLSFSEAGMRIMITSHFSPRTRLTMASRMLITERQRLINSRFSNGDSEVTVKIPGKRGVENGLAGPDRGLNGRKGGHHDDDRGGAEAGGGFNKLKWLLAWPLSLLLFLTVPNCATPRWERWYMVSFVISTLWIAFFSYIMVWMVTVIGYTMGVPDVIMGITFLAAGTSVPDCLASLIVARQGMGDMAVSNSIGSNVFDILIGLGLPWTLQTLAIDYGSTIHLNSKGLIFSVGLLLASVFLTVLGVHLNKWKLDKRLGFVCLLMYAVFLCFSILIEFNIFTFVNLPTCREE